MDEVKTNNEPPHILDFIKQCEKTDRTLYPELFEKKKETKSKAKKKFKFSIAMSNPIPTNKVIVKSDEELSKMSDRELRKYILEELKIVGVVSKAKNIEQLLNIIKNYKEDNCLIPVTKQSLPQQTIPIKCHIRIDEDKEYILPYPAGKTKKNFINYIKDFFFE